MYAPLCPCQCVANHINPYDFLPGFAGRPAPKCPHCGECINETLMEKERHEREEMTPTELARKDAEHMSTHCGGLHTRRPVMPTDNRNRSRGLLHRRMNIVSNCLAATLLRVPFSEKMRVAANNFIGTKLIWKMPETSKKRAKTIAAGNDARRLLSDPELLLGLLQLFYPEDWMAAQSEIAKLTAAAAANDAVRNEDGPAAGGAPARASKPAPARKNPIPVMSAGAVKGKKKKQVRGVLTAGGKKVTQKDTMADNRKARGLTPSPPVAATAAAAARGSRAAASFAKAVAESATEADVELEDNSLAPDDDEDEDDEMAASSGCSEDVADLEEDEKVGGLQSAIDVWLTAIKYTSDLHTPIADHFDLQARKAHADKCQTSGKAWALSINEHSANRALWQYVHDAFAHVHEDIMEHGAGDRNDDAILEKGNRRFKRLGDRCVMRGGRNGATWTTKVRVAEKVDGKKTGNFVTKKITKTANEGQAAQAQKLEAIAQICEAGRKAASQIMSVKQLETKSEQKVLQEVNRNTLLGKVEDEKKKMSVGCQNVL